MAARPSRMPCSDNVPEAAPASQPANKGQWRFLFGGRHQLLLVAEVDNWINEIPAEHREAVRERKSSPSSCGP